MLFLMNKSRTDNYPDDIRQHDRCPGSPFYVDPDEWQSAKADEIALKWQAELHETGLIKHLDYNWFDINADLVRKKASDILELLADYALEEVRANPEKYIDEPDYESLEWN